MVAVQPEQCSPVVDAFHKKLKPIDFTDFKGFPDTVAGGLADPHPWDGDTALEMLYQTKGFAYTVSDSEIVQAQRDLASTEGIFGEPSGVAAVGALIKMIDDGIIDLSDTIIIPITGHGLKDLNVLNNVSSQALVVPANINILEREINKNK